MAVDSKDTIYLDVDEEITGIVNKVQESSNNIVALVLPKRATSLQSIVNMKLLKRTADQNGKKIVLITSEAGLLPLAGAAGVHVASNLKSKPFLPPSPEAESRVGEPDEDVGEIEAEPQELDDLDPEETIEIDNSVPATDGAKGAKGSKGKPKKAKKGNKKLKVPNFDSFRKKMLLAVIVGILLIGIVVWAIFLSPKAVVTLKTESSDISANFDFTADTNADSVDTEKKIVPAVKREKTSNESEKAPATGQKDKGTKASGNVTLKNCGSTDVTIPAGTGVSNGSSTYITQSTVTLSDGNFDGGGNCKNSGSHVEGVSVVAQNNGTQYNSGPRSYTVAGFSGVSGQGDSMTGGTSSIVKVVSAGDVDTAKQKITAKKDAVMQDLQDQLKKDGYVPIAETFSDNSPKFTTSPAVDSEGNEVTVSATINYSMMGIKEDDLKKLVDNNIKDQIDTNKQSILSQGLTTATYKPGDSKNGKTTINIQTTVSVGPQINQDNLKKEIAGKKPEEAEAILKGIPGVNEAKVAVSPGWASKVPKKASKTIFIIQNADGENIDANTQP